MDSLIRRKGERKRNERKKKNEKEINKYKTTMKVNEIKVLIWMRDDMISDHYYSNE
jgi:hypothetical protein